MDIAAINTILECDSLARPDFAAAIYPAYRTVSAIPEDIPPLFIASADDDDLVAPVSAARLYEAWHKVAKSVELHIFADGGHGFGMNTQNLLSDVWIELFKNWLAARDYISSL